MQRELVDTLFELGLSISYDRVMAISANLWNALCHHFEMEKLDVPLVSEKASSPQLL